MSGNESAVGDLEEVERLLRRTRAYRDRVNSRNAAFGEAEHPIRSPLKERNISLNSAQTTTTTTTTKMGSPAKTRTPEPFKMTSTTTTTPYEKLEKNSNKEVKETTTTRVSSPSRSGGKETFKKTVVTEKEEIFEKTEVVRFVSSGGSSGDLPAEFEKNISGLIKSALSGGDSPSKRGLLTRKDFAVDTASSKADEDLTTGRQVFSGRSPSKVTTTTTTTTTTTSTGGGKTPHWRTIEDNNKFDTPRATSPYEPVYTAASGRSVTDLINSSRKDSGILGSSALRSSRPGSPVKEAQESDQAEIRRRQRLPASRSPSVSPSRSPIRNFSTSAYAVDSRGPSKEAKVPSVVSPRRDLMKSGGGEKAPTVRDGDGDDDDDDEEEGNSLASGRKRRLRALASKFHGYDEDDELSNNVRRSAAAASGYKSSGGAAGRPQPSAARTTKLVDVDEELGTPERPGYIRVPKSKDLADSLKAQGYVESDSKSKLSYNFAGQQRVGSPAKSPAKSSGAAGVEGRHSSSTPDKPRYRSVSPTRMLDPARNSSVFNPHPLQFISPSKAASAAPPKPQVPWNGPPKPKRTYADEPASTVVTHKVPSAAATSPEKDPRTLSSPIRTTAGVPGRLSARSAPSPQPEPANVEKSVNEKCQIFEKMTSPSKGGPATTDPALLPISKRMALFEKNGGDAPPVPIARFGQAVTPAMLEKAKTTGQTSMTSRLIKSAVVEPSWKRKRETSPLQPKMGIRSSPQRTSNLPLDNDVESTPQHRGSSRAFQAHRTLFESADKRKDSDSDDNKDTGTGNNELEMLRNRFRQQRDMVTKALGSEEQRPAASEEKRPDSYPGLNSLKPVKVSPPRPGKLYPDLEDMERPGTSMSEESCAISEAPSLGTAIKQMASTSSCNYGKKMPAISEHGLSKFNEDGEDDAAGNEIDDMLEEALDVASPSHHKVSSDGEADPTPPKMRKLDHDPQSSPTPTTSSASSWEYQNPPSPRRRSASAFKTPRVEGVRYSPEKELPRLETEDGSTPMSELIHTVSFYRKTRTATNRDSVSAPSSKENAIEALEQHKMLDYKKKQEEEVKRKIRKLQEEVDEQLQRRLQASKALEVCASKNEFEGSYERVEFERLLLEAHHKHSAAVAEINRLKTEGARQMSARSTDPSASNPKEAFSKGGITISGVVLRLKPEFVDMVRHGLDDSVHYFLCLVKYRSQVIATQMLSTLDGISPRNSMVFSNLINVNDLDYDFQVYLEVYGLQTPREKISHEEKYHIRKEKSSSLMFSLTPLKMLKRGSEPKTPRENPVNSLSIKKSKFGLVGYTTITIDNLNRKTYTLYKVPSRSPLEHQMEMNICIHSESRIEERGFLTIFMDVNGLGNWCRRWCLLKGTTLFFWKYPDDETNGVQPSEAISLHECFTELPVTLAPRDTCSRAHTFMLETERPFRHGDKNALNVQLDVQKRSAITRHLLTADTREDRLKWCNTITQALRNMRAWDPSCRRPKSSSCSSSSDSSAESEQDRG